MCFQGFCEEGSGERVLSLITIKSSKIVENICVSRMLLSKSGGSDFFALLIEWFRPLEIAHQFVKQSEIIQACRKFWMIVSVIVFHDLQ